MRLVWPILAVTAGIAHADAWSEYGTGVPLRPASQLVEASCEIDVTLTGAIASVEQRVRLTNPGVEPLAATSELALPAGAQLVALEVKHGGGKAEPALAVAPHKAERVSSPAVLGADPAFLEALQPAAGRPRFRLIVQPLATEHEATITTRWTHAATIRGGALRLVLPGRDGKPCRGTVHAKPGPGTSSARVRVAGKESTTRTFTLEATDLAIDVDLGFARNEPVVWSQTESLGDGWTAQAITVLAPPARATAAKRVLFVVDGSRSMELIGRHRVKQVVRTLAGTLTKGTEVEAIIYDRNAQRVLGAWKPIDATQLAAIETTIDTRIAGNGSNAAAALALAQQLIVGTRGETQIVVVTDGVIGDSPLTSALGSVQAELHGIVLTHARMRDPNAAPLRDAVHYAGGSYSELDVEELDSALATLDDWLRPSWLNVALDPPTRVSSELRAGAGFVVMRIEKRPRKPQLSLAKRKPIAARAAPAAPIAELVLVHGDHTEPTPEELVTLRSRHPVADAEHPFVVLATAGKIAKQRRTVTASGGPFTRMVALADPSFPPEVRQAQTQTGGSAIDRDALVLLFKTQLQPAAFACYQRALARSPALAGTVQFQLEIGRGETTYAAVTGLGDATFDACLVDAAYTVTPALPNPAYNNDDRTLVSYPLTFSIREQKPFVIAGDADSSSPLDIDAIKGGVPVRVKAGDTSTPLGNLRPKQTP